MTFRYDGHRITVHAIIVAVLLWGGLGALRAVADRVVDDDGKVTKKTGGNVDCDGSNSNYSRIDQAVKEAASGEVVYICPGTYDKDENITIDHDVEIKAVSGSVTLKSDAGKDLSPAILITETGSEINKVEIKGGITIEHTSSGGNGDAVTIDMRNGVEGVELRNIVVTRGTGMSNTNAAVRPDSSNITVTNSDITGGPIGFSGNPNGNYTIENTSIRGADDEGIWVENANNLTLRGNIIDTTGDGDGRDDRLGIAIYDVENQLIFENNDVTATEVPLLLGEDLPMVVNGTQFTLTSVADMRTVLGGGTINGGTPGRVTFLAQSDGTLRGEADSKGNNGAVHLVRTGVTNVSSTGGAVPYSQSALEGAQSGDVIHLTDGATYAETATLTSSPSGPAEADKNVSFASPGAATLRALHLEGGYTVGAPSGTLTVGDSLTLGDGSTLSGNPIVLGADATLDDNGFAAGSLKAIRTIGSGERVPFGNIGLVLTEKNGSSQPGRTTVVRTDGTAPSKTDAIQRYYDVSAATETGLNVAVTFGYDDAELNGAAESKLGVFKSDDGGSTWTKKTVTGFDLTADTLATETVSSFSRFTAAETGSALPVELPSFDATTDEEAVILRWVTASETDNAGFRVQHETENGFETLQFVEGAGTTTQSTEYSVRLSELDYGTHTFRLQQVDRDGSTHFSRTVEVDLGMDRAYRISEVAPNPVSTQAQLEIAVKSSQDINVALYDALGRHVATLHDGTLEKETTHLFNIAADDMASGSYFLRVRAPDFQTTRRLVVVR